MSQILLTNIVICYLNEDEVISYAQELSKQTIIESLELIVVVNKEYKGIEYLRKNLNNTRVKYYIVQPQENIGYLNGLLFGYKNGKSKTRWFILSNTDIVIPNRAFFEDFLNKEYIDDEKVWVVGPSVFAPKTNIYSNPYLMTRPSLLTYLCKNYFMKFPKLYEAMFSLKRKFKKDNPKVIGKSSEVYAIHGSFMFIRDQLLEVLSKQKPWELLYDEEQYIAEIRIQCNKIAYYDSTLLIHHMEGTSTGKQNVAIRYKRMRVANFRILSEFYQ